MIGRFTRCLECANVNRIAPKHIRGSNAAPTVLINDLFTDQAIGRSCAYLQALGQVGIEHHTLQEACQHNVATPHGPVHVVHLLEAVNLFTDHCWPAHFKHGQATA